MSVAWNDVERELASLAREKTRFATATATLNQISSYEPNRRIQVENEHGITWVEIESVRTCFERFESAGRIRRRDLLDPGRCSAFMFALFSRLPGVVSEDGDESALRID